MHIRLKRKTITILAVIFSIGAYALFVWIDWRLAVAMLVFELSNVFTELSNKKEKKEMTEQQFECAKANSCNVSGFEQWLANQGYVARNDADMDILRDVYDAMDIDDK